MKDATQDNSIIVTCTTPDGHTIETLLVNGKHAVFNDPIMYCELPIPMLVEAQFEAGGVWTIARGTEQNLNDERASLFSNYEKLVSKDPPDCLPTLRRMLQAGPLNKFFTGGGSKFVASHEGFTLRMPPHEVSAWQIKGDTGIMQDIARSAHAIRVWNAKDRNYVDVDPILAGAPRTPAELNQWFVELVKKLKNSPYIGSVTLDKLATSESHDFDAETSSPGEYHGSFRNDWTDLVVNTKVEHN